MPASSLRSVLLPAPLRPMMPSDAAARDLEADVAERPEGSAPRPGAAAVLLPDPLERHVDGASSHTVRHRSARRA